jgi:hypothetical protein
VQKHKFLEHMHTLDLRDQQYVHVHPEHVKQRVQDLTTAGAFHARIGTSRSGAWPLYGLQLGSTRKPAIVLTANNHAEEVVGTLSILKLFELLLGDARFSELLDRFQFIAAPQMNPDGVVNNWPWIHDPSPKRYLQYKWRDHRNEDVEHGIAVSGVDFVRPEPKALVSWYSMFADCPLPFYCTLHSCSADTGAFFLSGNEDLGDLVQVFEIIAENAQAFGLPLKGYDMRKYKNYRRLQRGVYSVPRHGEMKRTYQASDSGARTFLLNSLEWMLQRGVHSAFVSEVPMIIPVAYTEEEVAGVTALACMEPLVQKLEDHIARCSGRLTYLNGEGNSFVADAHRLAWYTEKHNAFSKSAARQLKLFLECFAGAPALRIHQTQHDVQDAYSRFLEAAMILNVAGQSMPGINQLQGQLDSAYVEMDAVAGLANRMTPLDMHMRYQLLMILAGATART